MFRASLCSSSGEQAIQIKLRVVNDLLCWLQSCKDGTRAVCFHTVHTAHAVVYTACSPDDGHNDARNMLS